MGVLRVTRRAVGGGARKGAGNIAALSALVLAARPAALDAGSGRDLHCEYLSIAIKG
jgi:hypothetical protein